MYLKCQVAIDSEDLKEHLKQFYDEEEVEDWTDERLQDECTDALNGILSDYFSGYQVIDENTLVVE
jgi:hypothetical protein